ncbi:alpha-N-acetylgalactosamine-specific lectin-like [Homarus americanus]|nr:alpha-N-acetylgalactosamine-specific lectin-like [Homarus americanus]
MVHGLLIALLLSCLTVSTVVTEDNDVIHEMRSTMVVSQLMLAEQTAVLQELLNASRSTLRFFAEESSCPYPYKKVLDECFYVCGKKVTFDQARQHCQGMAGDLAHPKHLHALLSLLFEYEQIIGGNVWMGATDSHQENTWLWPDGSPVLKWGRGEPSRLNSASVKEDCLELRLETNMLLNDVICTKKMPFVCQHP